MRVAGRSRVLSRRQPFAGRRPYTAYEDQSKKMSILKDAWQYPERPEKVIPTYQVMDESGKIVNEDQFPSEVISFLFFSVAIHLALAWQGRALEDV